MWSELIVLPLVGSFIGYVTNVIAIRMLFHPRIPLRLPGIPWALQGLIPMRQNDLARAIGDTVERDLLPVDNIVDKLNIAGYKEQVVKTVVEHAERRVRENLPRFIPMQMQDSIVSYVRDLAGRETGSVLDSVTDNLRNQLRNDLHVGELVEQKILELDLADLEKLVISVSHNELKHIEVLGAVLGFLIGLGQVGMLVILR